MIELWQGLGEWRRRVIAEEDRPIRESWETQCKFFRLFVSQFEGGRWLAFLDGDDIEEELELTKVTSADEAKAESLQWIRQILRAGLETLPVHDEVRFVQIATASYLPVGLTALGVVYSYHARDHKWHRLSMEVGPKE